jgi:dolichol kinase
MAILFTVIATFLLLLIGEAVNRGRRVHSEFSRKFVHISVGSFVAFWPYFLSWNQIRLLGLAFLVVIAASRYLQIFRAIHSVQRPTWGEFFFAIAVGLLSFVQHHPHIYTAALLSMSLADGLAAVVGTRFGSRHRYRVFGSTKSLIGSLTFFVVCGLILVVYSHTGQLLPAYKLGAITLGATLLENLGAFGSDNLLVPLFVGAVLLF